MNEFDDHLCASLSSIDLASRAPFEKLTPASATKTLGAFMHAQCALASSVPTTCPRSLAHSHVRRWLPAFSPETAADGSSRPLRTYLHDGFGDLGAPGAECAKDSTMDGGLSPLGWRGNSRAVRDGLGRPLVWEAGDSITDLTTPASAIVHRQGFIWRCTPAVLPAALQRHLELEPELREAINAEVMEVSGRVVEQHLGPKHLHSPRLFQGADTVSFSDIVGLGPTKAAVFESVLVPLFLSANVKAKFAAPPKV